MKEIKRTGFGWISPNGNSLGCEMFNHLENIFEWEESSNIPKIIEASNSLNDILNDIDYLIDNDEHPEWHNYEMAKDGYECEVYKELLNHGFIRIGVSTIGEIIEAEGKPEYIKKHLSLLNQIVDEYNFHNKTDYHIKAEIVNQ